jgi:hypothetical protein
MGAITQTPGFEIIVSELVRKIICYILSAVALGLGIELALEGVEKILWVLDVFSRRGSAVLPSQCARVE